MVDEARIDSDEDGFHLILTGDFDEACRRYMLSGGATLDLRLSQDAAIQLNAQVQASIGPWVETMNFERAAFARATPGELREVLGGAYDAEAEGRPDPEALAEAGDVARKAAREGWAS